MTVDLLAPRYKLIADYPHSIFTVGQILNLENKNGFWRYTWATNDGMDYEPESLFTEYPNIFKRLEWWEDRYLEDLPEYIIGRKRGNDVYLKVDKWFFDDVCGYWQTIKDNFTFSCPYATPITEQEYITYINNQSNG